MHIMRCPFRTSDNDVIRCNDEKVRQRTIEEEITEVIQIEQELKSLLVRIDELKKSSKEKLLKANSSCFIRNEVAIVYMVKELYIKCFIKLRDVFIDLNKVKENLSKLNSS